MMYIKWKSIYYSLQVYYVFLTQIENGSSKRDFVELVGWALGHRSIFYTKGIVIVELLRHHDFYLKKSVLLFIYFLLHNFLTEI